MKLEGGNKMNKKGMTGGLIAIIVIIVIIAFSLVFKFWLGPSIFFAQVDSAHEIIDKTYAAENAIYNYEWFKTQHEKIIAKEKQIDNTEFEIKEFKEMYGDPTKWDWQTRQDYQHLKTVSMGMKNFYEDLVSEYQARSKMANRNIFEDGLPFDVDKKIW
jgi:hypothetical protein